MRTEVIEIESAKTEESVPAVYEHPWPVRFTHWLNTIALFVMVGSGLADLPRLSQFRRKNSAARSPQLAEGLRHRRLVGRSPAVAPHLYVDLHGNRNFLSWISGIFRKLPAGAVFCAAICVASGRWRATIFCSDPSLLQPRPTTRFKNSHTLRHCSRHPYRIDRIRHLETSAVFLAGLADGRIPPCPPLAFPGMWAVLFFLFGHLVMVVLHGWNNFVSMLTGWKTDPDYPPR